MKLRRKLAWLLRSLRRPPKPRVEKSERQQQSPGRLHQPLATTHPTAHATGERGAVLLAVLLLTTVAAALPVTLAYRAGQLAAEVGARRDVLCARYAALGGLWLGESSNAAAVVGGRVAVLRVTRVRLSPSWCVLRASATCGLAERSAERTLPGPGACD